MLFVSQGYASVSTSLHQFLFHSFDSLVQNQAVNLILDISEVQSFLDVTMTVVVLPSFLGF